MVAGCLTLKAINIAKRYASVRRSRRSLTIADSTSRNISSVSFYIQSLAIYRSDRGIALSMLNVYFIIEGAFHDSPRLFINIRYYVFERSFGNSIHARREQLYNGKNVYVLRKRSLFE